MTPAEVPKGQRDHSGARLTRHALERFAERFGLADEPIEPAIRSALRRTRRLGRNPETDAVAVLGLHRGRVLVAVLMGDSVLTVLTWNQFEPRLKEFGRPRMPRKRGRMLRRLGLEGPLPTLDAGACEESGRIDSGVDRDR